MYFNQQLLDVDGRLSRDIVAVKQVSDDGNNFVS